jgi:putative hydrolase of the HAD superfamily
MIKNIIFDFGDVFINLDKQATLRELKKLKIEKLPDDMLVNCYLYEMGEISTEKFVRRFVDRYFSKFIGKEPVEKNYEFVDIWNAILLDFPPHRLAFLKHLNQSKKYRLFLLSNTNELHISWIQEDWGIESYEEFKSQFEQFYLSHEIGMRKPNANIYEFVLNENNLKAEETLFIDDTIENTKTAEKLGIRVWNIDPEKEDVVNLLMREGF